MFRAQERFTLQEMSRWAVNKVTAPLRGEAVSKWTAERRIQKKSLVYKAIGRLIPALKAKWDKDREFNGKYTLKYKDKKRLTLRWSLNHPYIPLTVKIDRPTDKYVIVKAGRMRVFTFYAGRVEEMKKAKQEVGWGAEDLNAGRRRHNMFVERRLNKFRDDFGFHQKRRRQLGIRNH